MADVVVKLKIMESSPDVDLGAVEEKVKKIVKEKAGDGAFKSEIEPIAFGLKALIVNFVMDESLGGTDSIEEAISNLEGVESVSVEDVRRTIG